MLTKEVKDKANRWKDVPCSWIGRINIVKMTIPPKAIYSSMQSLSNLPLAVFTELEQKFYNLCGNTKDPEYPTNTEKQKRSWRNQGP